MTNDSSGLWVEQQIISGPSITQDSHFFGYSITIDQAGEKLVISAQEDDTGGTNVGRVFVYKFDGSSFVEFAEFQADVLEVGAFFGSRVFIDSTGRYLVSTASDYDGSGGTDSGVVYMFDLTEGKRACEIVGTSLVAKGDYDWSDPADIAFTSRTTGAGATIFGLGYANGSWFFVADSGKVFVSPDDGVHWIPLTSGVAANLRGITYNGYKRIIIVGNSGTVIVSDDDGDTFTDKTSVSTTTQILYKVMFLNDLTVAVGANGTIIKSFDDGDSWTDVSISTTLTIYSVQILESGRIVAVAGTAGGSSGKIYTSDNVGTTWTERFTLGNSFFDITFNSDTDRLTIVGSGGKIYTSDDSGVTWTSRTSGILTFLYAVQTNGSFMLAVGASGVCRQSDDDGLTWTAASPVTTQTIWDVLSKDQGEFVICASSSVIETSPSGVSWADCVDWNRPSLSPMRYTTDIVDIGAWITYTPLLSESINGKVVRESRSAATGVPLRAAAGVD